eukprot:Skav231213  [mRNA]  locus=scaffold2958:185764:186891:- [translate_table: standard]
MLQRLERVLSRTSLVKDGCVSFKDVLKFILDDSAVAEKMMVAAGLYHCKGEYRLVKPNAEIAYITTDYGHVKDLQLWPSHELDLAKFDVSLYQQLDHTEVYMWDRDVSKMLGQEVYAQLTKPRDFSIYLVGFYAYDDGPDETYSEETFITVKEDGQAHIKEQGWDRSGECSLHCGFPFSYEKANYTSKITSVKRSPTKWKVALHGGADAHWQVVPPPLKLITLENGEFFDLTKFRGTPAILSGKNISYHGKISEVEGGECIVSFPGKYADGWRECAEGSVHDMSVACVFLTSETDGLGKHVDSDGKDVANPEVEGDCLCYTLYGKRGCRRFGYKNEKEYKKNQCRASWGLFVVPEVAQECRARGCSEPAPCSILL